MIFNTPSLGHSSSGGSPRGRGAQCCNQTVRHNQVWAMQSTNHVFETQIHLWLWSTPDLRANSGMPPIAANPKIAGKRPRAKEARLHAEQLFFNRLFVAISTIWSKWQHYPVKDVQHLMDIKVFYNLVWRRVSREFGTEEPLDANCVCRALGLDIVERDDTALLGRGLLLK